MTNSPDQHYTPPTNDYAKMDPNTFNKALDIIGEEIQSISKDKGFWPTVLTETELVDELFRSNIINVLKHSAACEAGDRELRGVLESVIGRARATVPRNIGEVIALEMSELSEALEAVRTDAPSDKLPGFTGEEEELADALIRIFDHGHARKCRLGAAVFAKMEVNRRRPKKHGKKF